MLKRSPLLLLLAGLVVGCDEDTITRPDPGDGGPAFVTVRATEQFEFHEDHVHVEAGQTVRWLNESDLTHSVTPVDHDTWESAEGGTRGQTILEHTFDEPGNYEYVCENHRGMSGTIHVAG